MNLRSLALPALLLGSSTFAFASFEEMFVVDAGSKSIKRYDPISGIYLGEIGAGQLNAPRGITYCSDNSIVVIDNYSTTLSGIKKFDADTGQLLAQRSFNGVGSLWGLDQAKNGNLYMVEDSGATLAPKMWMIDAALTGGFTSFTSPNLAASIQPRDMKFWRIAGTAVGYMCGLGNTVGFDSATNTWTGTAGTGQYMYDGDWISQTNGNNLIGFILATATNPPGCSGSLLSNCRDVAGGHFNVYAAGLNSGGTAVIARYDTMSGFGLSTFGAGTLTNPTYVAIHNAPEPASFAALGLGLAAIAKRRRKSARS